jgi:hypothetical protein
MNVVFWTKQRIFTVKMFVINLYQILFLRQNVNLLAKWDDCANEENSKNRFSSGVVGGSRCKIDDIDHEFVSTTFATITSAFLVTFILLYYPESKNMAVGVMMERILKDDAETDINLILFMFFGLAVGACITFLLNRYSYFGLPYTVGVFITGAVLSVLADHTEFLGDLGKCIATSMYTTQVEDRCNLLNSNSCAATTLSLLFFSVAVTLFLHQLYH